MRECVNPDASSTAELLVSSRSGAEDSLLDLLGLLNLFEASGDCRAAAVPFACQYLFPLCDSNGELYLPSAQQCRDVTTDVCVDVWQIALAAPEVAQRLPTCDELPENITACTGTITACRLTIVYLLLLADTKDELTLTVLFYSANEYMLFQPSLCLFYYTLDFF